MVTLKNSHGTAVASMTTASQVGSTIADADGRTGAAVRLGYSYYDWGRVVVLLHKTRTPDVNLVTNKTTYA